MVYRRRYGPYTRLQSRQKRFGGVNWLLKRRLQEQHRRMVHAKAARSAAGIGLIRHKKGYFPGRLRMFGRYL